MFPLLIATSSPAVAVDLDALVHAWTNTIDGQHGTDGEDEAAGIVVDDAGNIIAVGWLDGAAGHGSDGYMIAWNPNGTFGWEVVEDVGEIGASRTTSSDRLYDILVDDATGDLAVCGRRGADNTTHAEGRYLVERYAAPVPPFAPVLDWQFTYTYGTAATSPMQECFALAWPYGLVYGSGWAVHDLDDQGAWMTFALTEVEPVYITESFFFDHEDFLAAPDQAYDVAVDSLTDNVAIVGARGFSGLDGSVLNDIDWYVRYLSPAGDLLWEHTIAGASLLDDRARSVTIDLVTQDVYVAGWVNNGTDNAAGADLDWVVTRYDDDGDGLGGPKVEWTITWESAEGASEGATAIELDEAGDPLVAGWAIDELTNQEVWRVAKLTSYDGSPGQEWLGLPQGGNSRPAALYFFTDPDVVKIAVAGTIDSGAGRDFAAVVIEQDRDSDGTADSVDACPEDETKAADDGICGCGIPDFDKDGDGVANCIDGCPTNGDKTDPGVCGCKIVDTDTDGDATPDCDEICDDDPNKTNPGECGCGAPDNDTDGDGVLGCRDACANTPPGDEVDQFGCSLPDEPEDTDDDGSDSGSGGCGCAWTPGSGAFGAPLLAVIAASLRRRRRHTPRV